MSKTSRKKAASTKTSRKKAERRTRKALMNAIHLALSDPLTPSQYIASSNGMLNASAVAVQTGEHTAGEALSLLAAAHVHATLAVAQGVDDLAALLSLSAVDPLGTSDGKQDAGTLDGDFVCDEYGNHVYVSTACLHGVHVRCIQTCKFCGVPCTCPCSHDPALAFDGDLFARLSAALVPFTHGYQDDAVRAVLNVLAQLPRRNTPAEVLEDADDCA